MLFRHLFLAGLVALAIYRVLSCSWQWTCQGMCLAASVCGLESRGMSIWAIQRWGSVTTMQFQQKNGWSPTGFFHSRTADFMWSVPQALKFINKKGFIWVFGQSLGSRRLKGWLWGPLVMVQEAGKKETEKDREKQRQGDREGAEGWGVRREEEKCLQPLKNCIICLPHSTTHPGAYTRIHVWTHTLQSPYVEFRGQLAEFDPLLLGESGDWTLVLCLGSKHHHPLSYLWWLSSRLLLVVICIWMPHHHCWGLNPHSCTCKCSLVKLNPWPSPHLPFVIVKNPSMRMEPHDLTIFC